MLQLYTMPGSCSTGIHALLNKLQVAVEIVLRDDISDYQQLVPTNQVPALNTGDNILTEGAAIVLHLLRTHGRQAFIEDEEFIRWLMFNYATLHPAYSKLFGINAIIQEGEAKAVLMQALADKVSELWHIVDRHLGGRLFVYGDEATVLDYLLAIYVRWGNVFPDIRIPVGENVLALVNRVVVLPEFQMALENEGVSYSIPDSALPL